MTDDTTSTKLSSCSPRVTRVSVRSRERLPTNPGVGPEATCGSGRCCVLCLESGHSQPGAELGRAGPSWAVASPAGPGEVLRGQPPALGPSAPPTFPHGLQLRCWRRRGWRGARPPHPGRTAWPFSAPFPFLFCPLMTILPHLHPTGLCRLLQTNQNKKLLRTTWWRL